MERVAVLAVVEQQQGEASAGARARVVGLDRGPAQGGHLFAAGQRALDGAERDLVDRTGMRPLAGKGEGQRQPQHGGADVRTAALQPLHAQPQVQPRVARAQLVDEARLRGPDAQRHPDRGDQRPAGAALDLRDEGQGRRSRVLDLPRAHGPRPLDRLLENRGRLLDEQRAGGLVHEPADASSLGVDLEAQVLVLQPLRAALVDRVAARVHDAELARPRLLGGGSRRPGLQRDRGGRPLAHQMPAVAEAGHACRERDPLEAVSPVRPAFEHLGGGAAAAGAFDLELQGGRALPADTRVPDHRFGDLLAGCLRKVEDDQRMKAPRRVVGVAAQRSVAGPVARSRSGAGRSQACRQLAVVAGRLRVARVDPSRDRPQGPRLRRRGERHDLLVEPVGERPGFAHSRSRQDVVEVVEQRVSPRLLESRSRVGHPRQPLG